MQIRDKPLLDSLSRIVAYPYFTLLHSVRWHGIENVPRRGPAIIASNHQSYYDPIVICLAVSRHVTFMGLEKFFRYPVLGALMRTYGCLPVGERPRAPRAYVHMVRALRTGRVCGIFPEGGRTTDGLVHAPRPGVGGLALATGVPVIPVTLHGMWQAWPPEHKLPRPGHIEVFFGEPMDFRACKRSSRNGQRSQIALEIMLRIADGFARLGRLDLSRASRRRILREAAV